METVFVYGTLKKGFSLHPYLNGCAFVSAAVLPGYVMLNLGLYPGIVPKQGGLVRGELYRVEFRKLSILDEVEDVGAGLYRREKVTVTSHAGEQVLSWAYVLNRIESTSCYAEIADGIWKE